MCIQMVKMNPPTVRIGSKPYHCNKGTLEQSKANKLKFTLVETHMLNFLLFSFLQVLDDYPLLMGKKCKSNIVIGLQISSYMMTWQFSTDA